VNQVFGGIFFCEMLLKLFALRRNYFKENWNIFDFICVMSSVIGIMMSVVLDIQMATAMSAIRTFRIARLFRLVRFLKGLNRMFTALILSLPKLINVGGILLLFFFLFSVLGVQLFAKTRFYGPHDFHANFRDPGRAFLTLLRSVTGEGWNELMHSLSRDLVFFTQTVGQACVSDDLFSVDSDTYPLLEQKCLIDEPSACGKDLSYFYFIAFTCIMTMMMVNLFIAVILEAFSDSSSNDLVEVIDTAIRSWPKYDPDYILKASLKDTFRYIYEVALAHGVDLREEPDSNYQDSARRRRARRKSQSFLAGLYTKTDDPADFHISEVPMRIAKLCEVKVLPDGRVHFLYAVRMAVALTLSGNTTSVLHEFESAERKDMRLQTLRNQQQRKCIKKDEAQLEIPLQMQVAAAKIQARFRAKRKELEDKMRIVNTQPRELAESGASTAAAMISTASSAASTAASCASNAASAVVSRFSEMRQGQQQEQDMKPREAG